eukprot:281339-Rhodomonas_salina.1
MRRGQPLHALAQLPERVDEVGRGGGLAEGVEADDAADEDAGAHVLLDHHRPRRVRAQLCDHVLRHEPREDLRRAAAVQLRKERVARPQVRADAREQLCPLAPRQLPLASPCGGAR